MDPVVEQLPDGIRVTVTVQMDAEESDAAQDDSSGAADVAGAVVAAVVGTAAAVAGAALGTLLDVLKPDEAQPEEE